jgi:hypothetical protein
MMEMLKRSREEQRVITHANAVRRLSDPLYGKPVLLPAILLPPNYAGDPVTALQLIATQLRETGAGVQSRAMTPTYGHNLAGRLLIYAMKLGAFSSPEWSMWRMKVEGALRHGDSGPTYDRVFYRAVGADLYPRYENGCPQLAAQVEAEAKKLRDAPAPATGEVGRAGNVKRPTDTTGWLTLQEAADLLTNRLGRKISRGSIYNAKAVTREGTGKNTRYERASLLRWGGALPLPVSKTQQKREPSSTRWYCPGRGCDREWANIDCPDSLVCPDCNTKLKQKP